MSDKLTMTIEYDWDEEGWIVGRIVGVAGAISQGRTVEAARTNVIDALRLMLAPDDPDISAGNTRSDQVT